MKDQELIAQHLYQTSDIAKQLMLPLYGADQIISEVSPPENARRGSVVFYKKFENKDLPALPASASAYLLPFSAKDFILINPDKTYFFSRNILSDYIKLLELFNVWKEPLSGQYIPIEDPSMVYDSSCYFGSNVIIQPKVSMGKDVIFMGNNYVGHGCRIGNHVKIYPGVTILAGTVIGDYTTIHANTVIGSDGFGYEQTSNGPVKIPQIGRVTIGNHVEIGAGTTIDRAMIAETKISDHVKIDNQVQVGHNVSIGEGSVVAGSTGIAGSVKIGKKVILAGMVGVSDHAIIEDNVIVGGMSTIYQNQKIRAGQFVYGIPARPVKQELRKQAYIKKIPGMLKEIKELKARQDLH